MRLADFILGNIEPILVEWESFARSIWPSGLEKEPRELRVHAESILRAMVGDMKSAQSATQQSNKSRGAEGSGGAVSERVHTAADAHAIERVSSGFVVMMVFAEYRALRASVLRLWRNANWEPSADDVYDMTRFNESIDQSVTEALRSYTEEVDRLLQQVEKERLELEAQAQRTQKLESIGALAGGIAHNFNNLFAGLFGHLELARMFAKGGSISEVISTVDNALAAMERAKGLTQQLLTFSKGGSPATKITEISQYIRDAATFSLSGSNVQAHIQLPEKLWPCKIDTNQISQTLNNILMNAREAMPGGGGVRISAENIPEGDSLTAALPPGNYVRISIADQGRGIPGEALAHVFDPFYTTKETGTGLGLPTAYSIVKRHEGAIQIESDVNMGTTVVVYLPASSESLDLPAVEAKAPSRSPGRSRILVMDDESIVREVVEAMLKGIDYSVVVAASGEEAVQLYEEALLTAHPFDVAILDLTVPGGMGGKEAIKKLLEIDPEAQVVVSSGYSNNPVMANPTAYGFRGAISKPYRSKDLDDMLCRILGKKNGL